MSSVRRCPLLRGPTVYLFHVGRCESCHQLNLKKSVLMEVVNVLESSNKVWLAQQVRYMLSESSLQKAGDNTIRQGPFMTRYFYLTVILFFDFLLHCVDTHRPPVRQPVGKPEMKSPISPQFFSPLHPKPRPTTLAPSSNSRTSKVYCETKQWGCHLSLAEVLI